MKDKTYAEIPMIKDRGIFIETYDIDLLGRTVFFYNTLGFQVYSWGTRDKDSIKKIEINEPQITKIRFDQIRRNLYFSTKNSIIMTTPPSYFKKTIIKDVEIRNFDVIPEASLLVYTAKDSKADAFNLFITDLLGVPKLQKSIKQDYIYTNFDERSQTLILVSSDYINKIKIGTKSLSTV